MRGKLNYDPEDDINADPLTVFDDGVGICTDFGNLLTLLALSVGVRANTVMFWGGFESMGKNVWVTLAGKLLSLVNVKSPNPALNPPPEARIGPRRVPDQRGGPPNGRRPPAGRVRRRRDPLMAPFLARLASFSGALADEAMAIIRQPQHGESDEKLACVAIQPVAHAWPYWRSLSLPAYEQAAALVSAPPSISAEDFGQVVQRFEAASLADVAFVDLLPSVTDVAPDDPALLSLVRSAGSLSLEREIPSLFAHIAEGHGGRAAIEAGKRLSTEADMRPLLWALMGAGRWSNRPMRAGRWHRPERSRRAFNSLPASRPSSPRCRQPKAKLCCERS